MPNEQYHEIHLSWWRIYWEYDGIFLHNFFGDQNYVPPGMWVCFEDTSMDTHVFVGLIR